VQHLGLLVERRWLQHLGLLEQPSGCLQHLGLLELRHLYGAWLSTGPDPSMARTIPGAAACHRADRASADGDSAAAEPAAEPAAA